MGPLKSTHQEAPPHLAPLGTPRTMPRKAPSAGIGIGSKGRSISKKDYKVLKQVFIGYDKDNSGTVTYEEFLKFIGSQDGKALGRTQSAAGIFEQMDSDQSGEMDFKELLLAYYPLCTREEIQKFIDKYDPPPPPPVVKEKVLTEEQQEELESIMNLFDNDGDGKIERSELALYCANLGIDDDTIDEWFAQYDEDGNGTLEKEEFFEFFKERWAD